MIPDAELLNCAIEAARTAGNHALSNIDRRMDTIKTDVHDVKLKLDVECQKIAESVVTSHFPDHNILGEEDSSISKDDPSDTQPYTWIIDPIDGTVNFSHGFILWCCSVAVQYNGETVAGAVFAPAVNELYTASLDTPAMCNGNEISVSNVKELSSAMIQTGMDRKPVEGHEPLSIFRTIADNSQKTRITGSAALDLCRVACGQADGYFESDIYLWDVAAAGFITKRAGGKAEIVRTLEGKHRMQFLATNGIIHEELLNLLEPMLPKP